MRIGINASFARKPNTGIGQVTINFLKKLIELESPKLKVKSDLEFVLYLEEDLSPHQLREIFPEQTKLQQKGKKGNWRGDKPKSFKLPKNFKKKIFLPIWRRDDLIRKIWWERYLLPRKVKKDDCDIFISLYQSATIIPNEVKHIMLVHDIIPKLFPGYLNNSRKKKYWQLTEKAISNADKIITVSKRTEKDLIQHLGLDPAKISANYLDVDEVYKKKASYIKSQKILKKYKLKPGYIYNGGGLEVRKNTEGVIRAYKYLLDKNNLPAGGAHFIKEFPQLVISGKLMPDLAPLITDVEKLTKKLNLTKQVRILDFIPQKDLPALYANASMFVYPSKYEGFGIPVLEAMNQGAPVITAKTSSLPEVGGDSALYCDPDDYKDIAMVMKNVLMNKNLRDTLSRRGKERAKKFSWKNFVKKFLNVAKNIK